MVAISMPSARLCSSGWRFSVTVAVFVFALCECPTGTAQYLGSSCLTPERNSGTCVPVAQCNSIRALLSKPVLTANDVQYLESSRCGVLEKKVLVCCGAPSNGAAASTVTQPGQVPATVAVTVAPRISLEERAKLLPAECGIQYTDRIIGGERARIDEFPWTVLIQHRKRNGQLAFHCGGSLISNRYVLTAAHCINSIARSWTITAVRLGEWDLQSEHDCQTFFDEEVCSEPVQDIPVERIIVHPQYRATLSQVKNDIALIRLAQPARFNDFVQPICLPLSSEARTTSYDGKIVQVAGWGQTENVTQSQYKLFVSVKAVPEQICQQTYPGGAIDITQVCAGGEANKDSCRGDSGGALMFPEQSSAGPVMYIAGIVSYGRKCGLAGVPGVYTRVNQYIDWIIGNLDP